MGQNLTLFFLIVCSVFLLFQGCTAFTEVEKSEIEGINQELSILLAGISDGSMPVGTVQAKIGQLRGRIKALQDKGYSLWQILAGAMGIFLGGVLGVSRTKALNKLLNLLGMNVSEPHDVPA